jgi:signal transduction histidine kinase
VSDNGIGFDQEYAEKIFRPFLRLHTSADYEGSGIGLAICRRVATRYGGSLTADSELGKGSTFLLRLPAAMLAR